MSWLNAVAHIAMFVTDDTSWFLIERGGVHRT